MNFIKIMDRACKAFAFINTTHIVAVMPVKVKHDVTSTLTFTRIWTTAIEEGSENYGSVSCTFDTDELPEMVMEKILEATTTNHKGAF